MAALAVTAGCSDDGTGSGPSGSVLDQDAGTSPCLGTSPDPTCEQSCSGEGDCPSGFHCAEDDTCHAQCGPGGGCPSTHSCDTSTGRCSAESGPCASSDPPEGCERDCTRNADCPFTPQPMKCLGSICTAECVPSSHEGCDPDERCRFDGFCEPGEREGDAGQISEEVCNGLDDDNNGIIDDVDVDGDGICDCLKIATLGLPGQWGDGDVFAEWLSTRSDDGAVHLTPQIGDIEDGNADDQEITPALLEPFHVIVVQDVSVLDAFTQDEIDALNGWVQDGGGLMTLIGYADPDERTHVNSLLAPIGIQYGSEQILASSDTIPIDDFWADHPTTENIEAVGIDNGYPVVPDEGSDALIIAREGGHDVAAADTYGQGRVFVWGDEWITYDSEWAKEGYQVERFWLNLIKWLTPPEQCQVDLPPLM
ncbi:MAG: hypothetical protein ACOCV4_08530 [Myxococcota bacterium]